MGYGLTFKVLPFPKEPDKTNDEIEIQDVIPDSNLSTSHS